MKGITGGYAIYEAYILAIQGVEKHRYTIVGFWH